MATTTTNILCPNVGAAWANVLGIWTNLITLSGISIATSLITNLGMRGIQIYSVGAVDTNIYNNFCADIDATATKVPMPYVLSAPGWRAVPKTLPETSTSGNTKLLFENILVPIRTQILTSWCGATQQALVTTTNTFPNVTGYALHQYEARYVCVMQSALDGYSLTTKTPAVTLINANDAQTTDGLLCGQPGMVVGGTINEAVLAPLVAAVEACALIDVDYSANNGGSIFSLRGRVKTGV